MLLIISIFSSEFNSQKQTLHLSAIKFKKNQLKMYLCFIIDTHNYIVPKHLQINLPMNCAVSS